MTVEGAKVEVEDKPEEAVSDNVAVPTLTEEEARASGLSAEEVEAGKRQGLIGKTEPAKKPAKTSDHEKDETDDGEDAEPGEDADEGEDPEAPEPKDAAEEELDPEEEAELIKGYNANEKSLYWKAKKERLKRQDAQRESEHTRIKLAAAQKEIDLLKSKASPENDADKEPEEADGEEDDTRVMTVGEFKKMMQAQKKGQEAQNKAAQETIVRLEKIEAEFKVEHPDFDEVAELAREMMKNNPGYAKIMLAAASDPNDNAAEVVYNIGRLHPKYKSGGAAPADAGSPASKNKVDKAIANATKRTSSAAVAGGGTKRIVSENDLTVEDASRLSAAEYRKLSPTTRERLLRESCA